jgi:hypothetical protein
MPAKGFDRGTIPPVLQALPLASLRQDWAAAWGHPPPGYLGRTMLEASLAYKQREARAGSSWTAAQQVELDRLIRHYRRNPDCFASRQPALKPGVRLVRLWRGRRLSVLVLANGYEFEGRIYTSLSQLATELTGTRWNGWAFFGVKRGKAA